MKGISILGCGAFGTAAARVLSENVTNSDHFKSELLMFVEEEMYENEPLADHINRRHTNFRYLPGFKVPKNVRATSDLEEICAFGDIMVLIYPAKFVTSLIHRMKGRIKPNTYFVSFTKGLVIDQINCNFELVSEMIRNQLSCPCYAMVGATTVSEVVWRHFTESTIGCADPEVAQEIKSLFKTPYIGLTIVADELGVEMCGALKHVVAIAAGIVEGMKLGENTKAAVLRIGFWEMFELMQLLYPNRGIQRSTMEHSCGMAELFICMTHRPDKPPEIGGDMDLINIFVGRNISLSKRRASLDSPPLLLKVLGVHADGTEYARIIHDILQRRGILNRFPLFNSVHGICNLNHPPEGLIEGLKSHPIHG